MDNLKKCINCFSIESDCVSLDTVEFNVNGESVRLSKCYTFVTGMKLDEGPEHFQICVMCQQQCKNAYVFRKKFSSKHFGIDTLLPQTGIKLENENYEETVFASPIEDSTSETCDVIQHNGIVINQIEVKRTLTNIMAPKRHQCVECKKSYSSTQGLCHHRRLFHKKTDDLDIFNEYHNCSVCGKSFPNNENLRQHRKVSHTNHPPDNFFCAYCNKRLHYKSSLLRHLITVHPTHELDASKYEKETRPVKHYDCGKCDKSFTTNENLRHHQRKLHADEIFICDYCDQGFELKHNLLAHFQKFHPGGMTTMNLEADPETYIEREQYNDVTCLRCKLCNRKYDNWSQLMLHIEMQHNMNREKFQCEYCELQIKYKTDMVRHIRKKHPGQPINLRDSAKHECVVCWKKFTHWWSLLKHQRENHIVNSAGVLRITDEQFLLSLKNNKGKKYQCPVCGVFANCMKRHQELHSNSTYACQQCPRVFKMTKDLTDHISRHHSENSHSNASFDCNLCGNIYNTKFSLEKHRSTHFVHGPNTAACKFCHAEFQTNKVLLIHIRRQHKEHCFKCPAPKCTEWLTSTTALDAHTNIHKDVSANECLVCREYFSNFTELYQHYEIAHRSRKKFYREGISNVKCQCGLTFPTIGTFKTHVVAKYVTICRHCQKRFQTKQNLMRHLVNHDDYQPFLCTDCGFTSRIINSFKHHLLKVHSVEYAEAIHGSQLPENLRIHDDDAVHHKPVAEMEYNYECKECPKRYRFRTSLHRHIQVVHKGIKPPPRKRKSRKVLIS